jgi:DNA end-binding protein Ku
MPRPIWNGVISFGLLNVPVALYTGEKRVDLHFRMIDSRSKTPIRYERVNAETGEEVPWKDIVQAFEYEKGNYVVLSDTELASVAPEGKESIELDEFVERATIPTEYFEKPYYLVPVKKAEKGYALLREVLRRRDLAGIGHVMIRTRRYLCAVLVRNDALILNLLRFQQELVPLDDFSFPEADLKALRISPRELEMAEQLIDSMTVEWEPDRYVDDYRERLVKLVDKHVARKQGLVSEPKSDEHEPENAATNVVDFMALLKNSLNRKGGGSLGKQAASGKQAGSSPVTTTPKKKAARKAGAAKSPAAQSPKKSAPKTSARKKTAKG